MTLSATPEQQAILRAATNTSASLMIHALAGTGKTTTLVMLAQAMPKARSLAIAFNVKIRDELKKRFPAHFEVMTLNGLGHRAWQRKLRRPLVLEDRKIGKITTQTMKEAGYRGNKESWASIRQLVSAAMGAGLVPSVCGREGTVQDAPEEWLRLAGGEATEEEVKIARLVLIESIRQGHDGLVCFDDQIYLSALFEGNFEQYPVVFVDESQDLSPQNHLQVAKTLGETSRLVAVGDERQAIYAWRGADSDSMHNLRALRPAWIDLPLNTTFRCPKVIVARASVHAPGFAAAESNAKGEIFDLREQSWMIEGNKLYGYVATDEDAKEIASLENGFAVLCRNNAPLVKMAFKLLRSGVSVAMLGRDIGKGLVSLSKKLFEDGDSLTSCLQSVHSWKSKELALALANDDASAADSVTDRAGCLLAVMQDAVGVASGADVRKKLESLFAKETGRVTLSSGHRSKGLEWPIVLHLNSYLIPSKWAKGKQLEQEANLEYVITTRTKHTLVLANLEDFES